MAWWNELYIEGPPSRSAVRNRSKGRAPWPSTCCGSHVGQVLHTRAARSKILKQDLKPQFYSHCEISICAFTRAFLIISINQMNARPIIACYVKIFSFWHAAPIFDPSYLARETVSGNAWLSKNVDTVERFRTMGDSSKSAKGVNFYGLGAFSGGLSSV